MVTEKPKSGSWGWFILLLMALLVIWFSGDLIPSMSLDWLNFIPALAALYVGYCLIVLQKTCGRVGYVTHCLSEEPSAKKPFGSFFFSPWVRSLLLMLVAALVLEFGLRCLSYHRTLIVERQGDLLFTPTPNQEYIERISLTPSRINHYGLRGEEVEPDGGNKRMILCLGDSITYGFGVDDAHTYPAELQAALDPKYPGQYTVLNGGMNAYPMTQMHQKFLYLWNRGLHPQIAIVGYSMNEGWVGHLVEKGEAAKRRFEFRVWRQNHMRSIALYNFTVEKFMRMHHQAVRMNLIPGSNSLRLAPGDFDGRYEQYMQSLVDDLHAHSIVPVFLLFCSLDGRTGRYDAEGVLQKRFAAFAAQHAIPLLRSEEMFHQSRPGVVDLSPYFIDHAHMSPLGNATVARYLAEYLPQLRSAPASAATPIERARR